MYYFIIYLYFIIFILFRLNCTKYSCPFVFYPVTVVQREINNDRPITWSRRTDLSDVLNCPDERVRNERVRNSRARESGGRVRPFLASRRRGRESLTRRRARTLDVYLTRSNLIKNLIKSDFWAAPESVPNQPRRSNKTRKGIFRLCCAEAPPSGTPHGFHGFFSVYGTPPKHKRVSRFESLSPGGFFFSPRCSRSPTRRRKTQFEIVMRTTNANRSALRTHAAARLNNSSSLLLYTLLACRKSN